MKTLLSIALICFWSITGLFSQDAPHFYLDKNGITIKCENCQPGDTGRVNSILYEAVNRSLLEQRRDEGADLTKLCTSLVTDMNNLFYVIPDFNQDISSWDVSQVTNMSRMFSGSDAEIDPEYTSFNQDISAWDVSNVEDMSFMFCCTSAFNQDIDSWKVDNVTDMSGMFKSAQRFDQNIKSWNVSNVTSMREMFANVLIAGFGKGDTVLFNGNIKDWDVSKVNDISGMFRGNSMFNQDIGSWRVENVVNMREMFWNAVAFNQDIGSWEVSNVFSMEYMFSGATTFNQDLTKWCVTGIITEPEEFAGENLLESNLPRWGEKCSNPLEPIFYLGTNGVTVKCENCIAGDIGVINGITYLAVNNSLLRQIISTNEDISKVCTSTVTDMSSLSWNMENSDIFNQDISSWDVSSVTDMSNMFYNAWAFNQPIGSWDVSNVKNMHGIFSNTHKFNQSIGSWDVSNVKNMSGMFSNTWAFNQPIDTWDVSAVENMTGMFDNASSFYQDISSWCVTKIKNEPDYFARNNYLMLEPTLNPKWGECPAFSSDFIHNQTNSKLFTLHPNPVSTIISVELSMENTYSIQIISLNGQTVFETEMDEKKKQIDVSDLKAGLYLIRISSKDMVITEKLIKL